ncbi:MAG: hypothetical protein MI974_29665 [Chitinophagales bacterium]|nr:hypothetical protein [Chitinophagales bacterium]
MRLKIYSLLIVIPIWFSAFSQELPPITSFVPEQYQGGNQNWMLGQGSNGFIYVANNKGLLEFNGMQWTLYPSPNETIIRAVKAVGNRIYTGCYMEFGYWESDEMGRLQYHSLSKSVQADIVLDEHFWNIIQHENFLLFQSLDQIFIYNLEDESIHSITPPNGIDRLFKTQAGLFFADKTRQIYTLHQGQIQAMIDYPSEIGRIIHIWISEQGQVLIQTAEQGRFQLQNGSLTPVKQAGELKGKGIYSAISLQNGAQVFGTISDGILIQYPRGNIQYHLRQEDGISNNTILSLYEDQNGNVWAGTDNGISYVNLSSPIREYIDKTGQLGTVYAAAIHQEVLYLGTNQGLFYQSEDQNGNFTLVEGTKEQVWSLFQYEDQLFCAHNAGTFLIDDKQAHSIFNEHGVWKFSVVDDQPDFLLQGDFYGVSLLERKEGQWQYRNKIEGFDYSARYLEYQSPDEVYVSHEYKGVFGVKLDKEFRQTANFKAYDYPKKGENAGLATFNEDILYYSQEGMFSLVDFSKGFLQDTFMSDGLTIEEYESGKMSVDEEGRLWLFAKNNIYYFSEGTLSAAPKRRSIPIPAKLLNAMSGYENITRLQEDKYLIGTARGYLKLDMKEISAHKHKLYFTGASCRTISNEIQLLSVESEGNIPYQNNNLSFHFTVPVYSKYFIPQYQYRLEGFYNNWSEWSPQANISFRNLPFGSYKLEIRSMVGDAISDNTIVYHFTIQRPWYLSRFAIALYILGGLMMLYSIHRAYTRYYRQQERKIRRENERNMEARRRESELELVRLKNEQLQRDIDNKNRELAISTMSLVKKNELLHQIRGELQAKEDPNRNIRNVIKTIEKNTDEEETWNLFKEAFENADQDFFKKIQEKHPNLTHNDLKLCAYLRLNLSSKEVAPLLNISVRSVEVKRYRLRKKMELGHDEGLVEHILAI